MTIAPQSAVGNTVISFNPSTPGPGERFTITIRGTWSDGCVPQFSSFTAASDTTLQVDATANANCATLCTTATRPYAITTPPVSTSNPGIYTIEFWVTECNKPRTMIASQTLAISGNCQFDRSLTTAATATVGTPIVLRWCDPSVLPGPDQGMSVSFYRVLAAQNASGPFVAIGDVPAGNTAVGINFDASDVGPVFFFVEAHECTVTIAGCTGDSVLRSNIVRVDVSTATGCLRDATTLCLNGSRFAVNANWATPDGTTGKGQAVSLSDDSGYFWFFGPNNVELVVKALNACTQSSPRYWVFASGLTNVQVELTVTDTKSGIVKRYTNPLGTPFQPIQDTGAFATCP